MVMMGVIMMIVMIVMVILIVMVVVVVVVVVMDGDGVEVKDKPKMMAIIPPVREQTVSFD